MLKRYPLIILLAAAATLANIAPGRWVEPSSYPVSREHPAITMADEEVWVWFWEDVVLVEAWYDMLVQRDFGRSRLFLPMYFSYPELPELGDFEPWVEVSIDGEAIPATAALREQRVDGETVAVLVQAEFAHDFEPGVSRIEVAYLAPYVWRETADGLRGCFEYPLGTGGAWREPIGHGVLHLAPGPGADWELLHDYGDYHLPEPEVGEKEIRWEFTELEPPPETAYWILR
ncbi:MAG: hypothetical protein GF399_04810 [Candidatus Coatesbacteria bacterium]|nr:hypothetical protein [Candidatus Coatesbacteria bacterium]